MTDLTKWRMVPVEAVREMLDAAHFGPNCAEEGLSAQDEQFWIDVWEAMIAASPAPPVVSVTDEMAHRVANSFYGEATLGNKLEVTEVLQLWQRELGPALGMVAREEMARMVEAAYRECASELCHYDTALVDQWWAESAARKRLEGGR